MARRKLIAGNWKMNCLKADAKALASDLAARMKGAPGARFDMLVCPPFPLIPVVADTVAGSGISVGGQDCHAKEKGAHTGDTSAWMLKDVGCTRVIVGHSERRTNHAETDAQIKAKAEARTRGRTVAIVCIGETLAERDAGKTPRGQPDAAARLARRIERTAANTVIAYEPVWAIGTGRNGDAGAGAGSARDDSRRIEGPARRWRRHAHPLRRLDERRRTPPSC